MTEQQQYHVLRTIGSVEVRRYEACVMADVNVTGDYRKAAYAGFRPLLTYISRHSIAMTAPVVQEGRQQESWRVSFVMPAGMTLADLPHPPDQQVRLRELPAHDAAAIRFSGYTTRRRIAREERRLRTALTKAGLTPTGEPRIARFNPPWTPGFLRRNEIVLDLQPAS